MGGQTATKASTNSSAEGAGNRLEAHASRHVPSGPYADVLALQRSAGNRAVTQVLEAEAGHRPPPSRSPSKGEGGDEEEVPPIVHEVLRSPGQPLDPATRALMDSRFGHDFTPVRVHTDRRAAESAQAVNALAYTVGKSVVFGAGQYAPATGAGQQLLAHELTHVVQQQTTGRIGLARQPAQQPTQTFETNVAVLDPSDMEKWAARNFWLQRIGRVFVVAFAAETAQRFKDPEEQDAVLAALWRVRPDPSTLASKKVQYVQIPSVARSNKQAGELLYRFVFIPKQGNQTTGKVEIYFEAEHPTSVVTLAPTPPAGYEKETSSLGMPIGEGMKIYGYHHEGFPQGDVVQYWTQHPDEEKQLFYWIAKQGRSFGQIVVTKTTERKGKAASVRQRPFLVRGSKDNKGRITDLTIEFLGTTLQLSQVWLPADYHSKDAADALLQEIQEQPDPTKQDRLGKVTLGNVPKEEAFPLKYTIWGYFRMGTRNAEVDTIISIAETKRRIFYTLRFRPNNDVDVERIGEEGKEARLDPNRLDIAWVNGYESNADDPKKLKSWLRKRYPGIKSVGNTAIEVRDSANKALQAEAGTPAWFKENYRIHVLDQAEGEKRLEKMTLKKTQIADVKAFTADELKLVEFSLEPMSENILKLLQETRLVRQKTYIAFEKNQGTFAPRPDVQGTTYKLANQNTVVIFDAAMKNASLRFLGGAAGVRPVGSMTPTHEFGHVLRYKASAGAQFNQFVKDEGIQPFTPYAARDPKGEFFEEAFYLYETDPEWLKSSHPEVFEWFETLSKTGKPPVQKKRK